MGGGEFYPSKICQDEKMKSMKFYNFVLNFIFWEYYEFWILRFILNKHFSVEVSALCNDVLYRRPPREN